VFLGLEYSVVRDADDGRLHPAEFAFKHGGVPVKSGGWRDVVAIAASDGGR
jgi:hypothetical protein